MDAHPWGWMNDLVPMGWRMKGKLATSIRCWLAGSLTVVLIMGLLSGCQPIFMGKEIYEQAHMDATLPPAKTLENCPIVKPVTPPLAGPPNVINPDRDPCPITLQEAIAKALENGLASGRTQEGKVDTNLASFGLGTTSMNNQTDRIRVLALNPAISNTQMEVALARFDAVWVTGMNWTNTDNLQQGLSSFNNGHGANLNSSIIKAFADGSVANVSFITNYQNLNTPPTGAFNVLNPQYTTKVSFGYEVPLWRDSGAEINQLLPRLSNFTGQIFGGNTVAALGFNGHQQTIGGISSAGPQEGILISKLRFDQSRVEFERNVQVLVKNVEIAYWNLYNKYGQLYAFEENLRILRRAYEENYHKYKAGGGGLKPYQFFQSKGQFEEFRANRVTAMQEVLDAERHLRGLLGMPMEDHCRLIPITPPQLVEMRPDWEHCLQDTLELRPELVLARDNLRYHQYLLQIQKNILKPDLRFFAKYEPTGFGSTLTGDGEFTDGTNTVRTRNALTSLRQMHFADYTMGLYLNVPIGQRAEHAAIRASRMQLAQSYYFLRDQEERAIIYLTEQYQEVSRYYKQIETHRAERLAYADALNSFINLIKAGTENYGKLDFLSIQRSYSAALVKEYGAIAEYNNAMARLEFAKGTTLRYNNVHISEGALPECAQVNASQYEKERTRSMVLKQRPDAMMQPGRYCATKESDVPTPDQLPPIKVSDNPENFTPPMPKELRPGDKFTPPMPKELLPAPRTLPGPLDSSWSPNKKTQPAAAEVIPMFGPAKTEPLKIELPRNEAIPAASPRNSAPFLIEPGERPMGPAFSPAMTPDGALPKLIDEPVRLPTMPASPRGPAAPNGTGFVELEEAPPQILSFPKNR